MATPLNIQIYEKTVLKFSEDFDGPVELGRQRTEEPEPYNRRQESDRCRLVMARRDETGISRNHVLFEPLDNGQVCVTNVSAAQPVALDDASELRPGARRQVPLPLTIRIAGKSIRVQAPGAPRTEPPPEAASRPRPQTGPSLLRSVGGGPVSLEGSTSHKTLRGTPDRLVPPPLAGSRAVDISSRTLIQWLHTAVNVLRAAADSDDFFERAARAVVDLVELDAGRVLLRRQDGWQMKSLQLSRGLRQPVVRPPSQSVLQEVLLEKRTVWEKPGGSEQDFGSSLADLEAVVAAPMLDRNGEVVGVLYGERCASGAGTVLSPITEVEAMLVELLALGVTVGQARLEQEQAALAERVRFEQFFTPELADQLSRHHDWLEGREAEVSVLFCDIRGFSGISERLGAQRTVEWCRDVLDELSDSVLRRGGVLVDYTGDGLMAMWGAPEPQADHAHRACQAALDMLGRLPALNQRWQPVLECPVELSIGVNTGMAQVGNTGSRHKFKYGPRGNTVNLASRVEGVTKQLKCPLLITAATRDHLDDSFRTRRLAQVRVVNIVAPVEMHELTTADRAEWPDAKREYEKALEEFERQEFGQAVRTLGNWRGQNPHDGPALVLLHRAVTCMVQGAPASHPVFVLSEK
jgi:adenylate cyclase